MIKLTKDKIMYTNHYGEHSDKYAKKEVHYLTFFLENSVELSDDFTLGDLFYHLEKIGEPLIDSIFGSALGHFPFKSYIQDMKTPAEDAGDKLDYLEIQRCGERWEWGDIDLSIDFHGVGESSDWHYAIEFTPLYVLKDLPLRLNKEFTISEMKIPSKLFRAYIRFRNWIHLPLSEWNSKFSYNYVKGTTCFSVRELISAVLSEISFAGSPEMRDKWIAEIVKDVDETKQEVYDGE